MLPPLNRKRGQRLTTDASGVTLDHGFLAHFQVAAAAAVAASANGVHSAINLGAATQQVTTGITNPAVPRALSIVGNVSGVTGDVTIEGTNYAGEAISETLALNGTTTVNGDKAFRTVTKISLPAQSHTPVAQVEIATVAGTIEAAGAGNASVVVTAAGMTGSPKTFAVAVANNDTAAQVAAKIRTALTADAALSAMFNVGGTSADVQLTRKVPAANDSTLNIAIDNGTCAGLTTAASSANTTAGVPYDTVSVGWNDKLGLPYRLAHNTVIPGITFLNNTREATDPTVTVSPTAIESNTIDLNSALGGTAVDVYLVV